MESSKTLVNTDVEKEIKRQKNLEKDRRYRLKNVDKIREAKRARYAENKDKAKAKRQADKEKTKARYESKKEIIKERSRAWYVANKEAVKEKYQKQRKLHIANSENKTRQRRKNWTLAEEKALINFLKQNVAFEKPSAQMFYNHFLQTSGVNGDWKMVRLKMYNMRRNYRSTREWLHSEGAALTDARVIRDAVCSKFRYYYDFEEIFGSNIFNIYKPPNINSETISDQMSNEAPITVVKTENEAFEIYYDKMSNKNQDRNFPLSKTLLSHSENEAINKRIPDNNSTTCRSRICLRSLVSEMIRNRADIYTLGMEKMKYDTILREKKLKLLEKQVAAQEGQLELKEIELNSQEHLKIIALEMKEKSAMTELELKYKN